MSQLHREEFGEGSEYIENYLGAKTQAYETHFKKFADECKFQRYEQRMPGYPFMKKGPKREWYLCDGRGFRAKYGWGQTQRFWQAGYPMQDEPLLMELLQRISHEFNVYGTHAILKYYADGKEQSSPPHKDKAAGVDGATADKCDMAGDAPFFVFSFGFPRVFTCQKGRGVPNPIPSQKEVQLKQEDIVWKKALPSGSMLKYSAADNRKYFHALHRKKDADERLSLMDQRWRGSGV